MDVLNSSFRDSCSNQGVNYLYALAGALMGSGCIKGFDVYVFKDGHDDVDSVRIQSDFSGSSGGWRGVISTDLRFNVPFDKNELSVCSDCIYIRLSDSYDNRMFVSYITDDEASFDDFACWLGKAMERFMGIIDCDRVR
ncbi:MAG: hypothetical protein [Caudoviricetes sp.]|nr:MAG: hypothetical protein [Caudoviricetes sp.]